MLVRQKITLERQKNKLTVSDLADRLGVTKGTVSRWENGYIQKIPSDMIIRMADLFNISLEEFVGDDIQYNYLIPGQNEKHSQTSSLTDDENAMLIWYRSLSAKEKSLIRRLWQSA